MATTPPPPSPSTLRVPAAPLHGTGYDQFEPYPTRYSARLANQRASRSTEKTHPPNYPDSPRKMQVKGSPKKCRKMDGDSLSLPGSNAKSKRNERSKDHAPSLAYHNDLDLKSSRRHPPSHLSESQALPTPAKTPSKRKITSDLSSTSRNLFPTTSSRLKKKKSGPFSLESFETTAPQSVEIWTDSRDRIPVPDASMNTPFVSRAGASPGRPVTRSTARERPGHPVAFTFRGEIVTRYLDDEEEDDPNDLGLFASRPDLLPDPDILKNIRPLSRKDIKPRTLWPTAYMRNRLDDDPTDVEDNAAAEPSSPTGKSPVATPEQLEFPQAPGASHFLRSKGRFDADFEGTPTVSNPPEMSKRGSPFNQWLRKKGGPEETTSATPAKRDADGESGTDSILPSKRTRSSRATQSA